MPNMTSNFLNAVTLSLGYSQTQRGALRPSNFITEFFKWMLTKNPQSKRQEAWDALQAEGQNLDTIFKGIAGKNVSKLRIKPDREDLEDMIQDALMQTVTPKTIKEWDGRDPIKYFGHMFDLKMINQVRNWVVLNTREQNQIDKRNPGDDRTVEEQLDSLDTRRNPHDNPLENYVQMNDLLRGLNNFFKTKPSQQQQWLAPMTHDLIQGKSLSEIAEGLGVSKAIMSKRLDVLGQYMAEYANRTNNTLLQTLLKKYLYSRKHNFAVIPDDALTKLFRDYKLKKAQIETLGSFEEGVELALFNEDQPEHQTSPREPSGKIRQIQIHTQKDPFDSETLAQAIMDSGKSTEELQGLVEESIMEISSYDDILDLGDGTLVGLLTIDKEQTPK